jgi:biotin carboxyl carrier protein
LHNFEVEANGRVRHVTVDRAGDTFAVTVDGRRYVVDAARIGEDALSLIADGKVYDVSLVPDRLSNALAVRVGSSVVSVAVNGRRQRARRDESAQAGSGPLRVVAPMPGRVVRVAVKPGETVRARQTLVVVEAMKMENELRSGRDGVVGELHAEPGQSVDAGALLVVIQ